MHALESSMVALVAIRSGTRYAGKGGRTTYHNPFASGAFRWVAKGVYTSGARSDHACVLKWFKTGAVFEDDYFALDIKAVDRALEIVPSVFFFFSFLSFFVFTQVLNLIIRNHLC